MMHDCRFTHPTQYKIADITGVASFNIEMLPLYACTSNNCVTEAYKK